MTARVVSDTDVDLRLLLVEDDAGYAGFIGATLMSVASAHFQYDHVTSISAAVERLSETAYDLVLLDLGLPDAADLDGLTTVVAVVPDLPVVILSSAEDEALALRAVKAGAQDYLSKGNTTGDVLARSIRYAIERKHSELQIKRLAYRDSLTQLPNRTMLMEHLDAALKRAHRDAARRRTLLRRHRSFQADQRHARTSGGRRGAAAAGANVSADRSGTTTRSPV